jgi:hypothetical protein
MEVTIGLMIVAVFLIVGWQQLRRRLPQADPLRKSAEILINTWAQARGYHITHKSFIERQRGAEKRLFYEVFVSDAENKPRNGVAVCVLSNDHPEHGRVDMVWK